MKMLIRTNLCEFHVAICGILSQSCDIIEGPQPEKYGNHRQSMVGIRIKTPCISSIVPSSNECCLLALFSRHKGSLSRW